MSRKTVRRVQRAFRVVFVIGLALLIGTAGASDADVISWHRILWQSGIGLLMLFAGARFGGLWE